MLLKGDRSAFFSIKQLLISAAFGKVFLIIHDGGFFLVQVAILTILPSVNERDSIGFNKPRAVLPRGFLQVPAADR